MFRITQNKGFQLVFENGYEISCQFGYFNYCNNKSCTLNKEKDTDIYECKDCEIAIFHNSEWVENEDLNNILQKANVGNNSNGIVMGYVSSNEVARIIDVISNL